ncbi:hypothetical protein FACS189491_05270 [Spirochaetia bacterium]|nr:hypothetical protein FACS189491_05270 [Spirochaetia bacterium]
MYLFYSVGLGVGTAIMYPSLTAYAAKIFPDKPGFASGLMLAGYGCGPFVLSPIIARVYVLTGDVSKAFFILGCVFVPLIFILCLFIKEPEKLPVPEYTAKKKAQLNVVAVNRNAMIRTPVFYVLYLTFAFGIINTTMILTQAAPILKSGFALSTTFAASLAGAFALSNTVGRFICGFASDKIGRPKTIIILQFFTLLCFILLLTSVVLPVYIFALALCIFCLGGLASSLAPATGDTFSTSTLSENYPVMFSIFTVAGIAGVQIITNVGYTGAYFYGLVTAVIGIVLSFVYQQMLKKQTVANAVPAS